MKPARLLAAVVCFALALTLAIQAVALRSVRAAAGHSVELESV